MKDYLPLKMTVLVLLVFCLLFVGMALWKQIKVLYYGYRLDSENKKARADAVKNLLALRAVKPLLKYYDDLYASEDVIKRMGVLDELCAYGDSGKELMRVLFRNRCMKEQVRIPGGMFTLRPCKTERMKRLFVDKYEVTNEKAIVFSKCSGYPLSEKAMKSLAVEAGSSANTPTILMGNSFVVSTSRLCLPVAYIGCVYAEKYAEWLGMRLPTITEWEYAALAGFNGKYCHANNLEKLTEYAWFKENSRGKARPVGLKKPNPWGLYDMHGNVWEWCALFISSDSHRPICGGGYVTELRRYNLASYEVSYKGSHGPDIGFRVVRESE
ncbi:MAG: formylglycine-generating enzyme family protein [Planctomycetota bacterium]|jgi:formylglycine-generating enzyme required for sulfatase activity